MKASLVKALPWLVVFVAVLVILPLYLPLGWQNAMVNVLIAALFATSFNLLMGQGGMLSFGHAAYYGVGAMAVLHMMTAIEDRAIAFPTPLLPLAGALAGLLVGLVAGYFATMRTGVYFSLVTLALAELLHSLAPHWDGVFGGEAGISSMRMPWGGVVYGQTIEVYYTTLAWVVVCIALLYLFTRTPFGRLTLAIRENEQRVRFLGYDTHKTKVLIFAISAMFSGVAGGLLAMSLETANYTLFATTTSAQVVLYTFVGGSTVFFGPMVGAAIFTIFAFLLSDLSHAWLLYQGVIFVLVMLYAPFGLGGIVQLHAQHWRYLDWGRLIGPYAIGLLVGLALAVCLVYMVESLAVLFSPEYAVQRRDAEGGFPPYELFGASWSPFSPLTWAIPVAAAAVGFGLLPLAKRTIGQAWEAIRETRHRDIEERSEALTPDVGAAQ